MPNPRICHDEIHDEISIYSLISAMTAFMSGISLIWQIKYFCLHHVSDDGSDTSIINGLDVRELIVRYMLNMSNVWKSLQESLEPKLLEHLKKSHKSHINSTDDTGNSLVLFFIRLVHDRSRTLLSITEECDCQTSRFIDAWFNIAGDVERIVRSHIHSPLPPNVKNSLDEIKEQGRRHNARWIKRQTINESNDKKTEQTERIHFQFCPKTALIRCLVMVHTMSKSTDYFTTPDNLEIWNKLSSELFGLVGMNMESPLSSYDISADDINLPTIYLTSRIRTNYATLLKASRYIIEGQIVSPHDVVIEVLHLISEAACFDGQLSRTLQNLQQTSVESNNRFAKFRYSFWWSRTSLGKIGCPRKKKENQVEAALKMKEFNFMFPQSLQQQISNITRNQ